MKEDFTIWRYLDFADLVALLEYRGLFFAAPSCLEDPYEKFQSARLHGEGCSIFVNCWHRNESESVAMWRLYSGHKLGLALKSTITKLRRVLRGTGARVSPIRYMALPDEDNARGDSVDEVFCKRREFEYENELRAVLVDKKGIEPDQGRWVDLDLNALIDCIVIAPTSEQWLEDLVTRVVKRYGLNLPVIDSGLACAPGEARRMPQLKFRRHEPCSFPGELEEST